MDGHPLFCGSFCHSHWRRLSQQGWGLGQLKPWRGKSAGWATKFDRPRLFLHKLAQQNLTVQSDTMRIITVDINFLYWVFLYHALSHKSAFIVIFDSSSALMDQSHPTLFSSEQCVVIIESYKKYLEYYHKKKHFCCKNSKRGILAENSWLFKFTGLFRTFICHNTFLWEDDYK